MTIITHQVVSYNPFTVEFTSGNKSRRVTYPVIATKEEIELAYDHIDFLADQSLNEVKEEVDHA